MNFSQLSGDLASFCGTLWEAAGQRASDFCDMDIEFGGSAHSGDEVNDLIDEAVDGMEAAKTLYFQSFSGGAAGVSRLLSELRACFEDAHMIGHALDLPAPLAFANIEGWSSLKHGNWHVCPSVKDEY